MEENLWPDIPELDDFEGTPKMLLENLVEQLREKYKKILEGRVETSINEGYYSPNSFIQNFYIIAPMLNNYEYELFRVEHDLFFEKITCDFESSSFSGRGVESIPALKKFIIDNIINADSTKRILASLYYQSMSNY